jgi:aspartyl-tRNA(Asn)/glutamyl-tRNA(Gln) amidotransferase subunit C
MPEDIDIAKVAKLARIALTEEELELLGRQLGDILEHAELVRSLPTDGVLPTSHPLPMTNAFRPDVVAPSLDRDEVLSQAPDHEAGYFKVPRILDGGEAAADG